MSLFDDLETIDTRPRPFAFYTAGDLWTDEHTSARMLAFHLDETLDVASRSAAFIDRSVKWIVSRFKVGQATRLADFGCGPGLYTTRLVRRGAKVTGIDFSPRSIAYAQKVADRENLPITYVNQNYLDFDTLDRFDLILMIMCDFCALSPTQRKQMLAKFHALLKPGGMVLLDVYSLSAYARRKEKASFQKGLLDGFWAPDIYYGFRNNFKYDLEKVILDKYTIVERHRTRVVYNWLQYFSPGDLEKEFMGAGFSVEAVYGDVSGAKYNARSDEFAVVAKRGK
jgi:SAM-dependent methyltransferase